jgi:hypothetical protein
MRGGTSQRKQVEMMSRIIVVPDSAHPQLDGCAVLMDEEVLPEHVLDGHSADQLIERVAWAVCDASDAKKQSATDVERRTVRHHR